MKRTLLSLSCCAVLAQAIPAADAPLKYFYVYSEKSARTNHYIPAGWMGDYGDLKIQDAWKADCKEGTTCMKWTYTAKGAQGQNWAGVYWQHPPNNWGTISGGYDLSPYRRLTFWARGEKGGEIVSMFGIGGIAGEYGDSDAAEIGPITLTKDWKRYQIDLVDKNLAKIIGGFRWATNADSNPEGFEIYLDEIRFER